MKTLDLPLSRMTAREKLHAIEAIWDDLSRQERDVGTPKWQTDVLQERERRRKAGKEPLMEWEKAKRELRRRYP